MDGAETTTPDGRPAPPIDPRIRARRIEVRRQAGRQRLARLVDVALVLVVAALFVGALWTPLLDVDRVEVSGLSRLPEDAVLAAAGVEPGDPLVSLDPGQIGARIAALPWVSEVEVSRGVDGTIALAVTERVPVARVGEGATVVVVDAEGRGLAAGSDVPDLPDAITLTGLAPPEVGGFLPPSAAAALSLAAVLADQLPGAVLALDAETMVGQLVVGGEVAFDDASRIDDKVRSLATVLEQVDLTCLARVDLSLPANAVLTREEGCS